MRRIFVRTGLFAAVLALASGVAAQEKKQIVIGTSSSSIPAGAARIAKEMGLFEKHGVDARVTALETGITATSGLLSGSLDFVTTGPSDVVLAQANGQDIVALTSVYRGFAANIVVSKEKMERAGVTPNSSVADRLKAMNGLTIASTSAGSTFTVGLKGATEGAGAKVNVTYMSQPAMIAAFQRGAIDGFTVSSPYYVQPIALGTAWMWISGPRGDFPKLNAPINSAVVITRRETAAKDPATAKKVVAVIEDFWKAVAERPADVKVAMKKLWPDLDAATLDAVFEIEKNSFKAKPITVEDMAHEIAFMKLGGFNIPQVDKLDPKKMIYP
jgi:ABC-type nitrate/sulfonate/bicarbonate transport system substrate-binding protein